MKKEEIISKLKMIDRMLESDNYKVWSYARMELSQAIDFIQNQPTPAETRRKAFDEVEKVLTDYEGTEFSMSVLETDIPDFKTE